MALGKKAAGEKQPPARATDVLENIATGNGADWFLRRVDEAADASGQTCRRQIAAGQFLWLVGEGQGAAGKNFILCENLLK